MGLSMAFCGTRSCWVNTIGFQYRGSVASCESRRARTLCSRFCIEQVTVLYAKCVDFGAGYEVV
jgi:hypothetical protein